MCECHKDGLSVVNSLDGYDDLEMDQTDIGKVPDLQRHL